MLITQKPLFRRLPSPKATLNPSPSIPSHQHSTVVNAFAIAIDILKHEDILLPHDPECIKYTFIQMIFADMLRMM